MRIYFMGICGTAMGQAALLMRELGHEPCGADSGIYPPMSDVLRQAGIEILEGYDERRLERLQPDLVVVGNAQSRGHPEVEWLLETRAFPILSLPALLQQFLLCRRQPIVICGTHGKTTTTTITAHLLRTQTNGSGWLIGGVPMDLPAGAQAGNEGGWFAIEGDEYDSAFFDKRSKFIHYSPRLLVCNNLEFDHADIFRDLEDVQRTFRHVLRLVPRHGWIVANGDDPRLAPLLVEVRWTRLFRVGTGPQNDLQIINFQECGPEGSSFRLAWKNGPVRDLRWSLPGLYNARNAAMAIAAVGLALHPDAPAQLDTGVIASLRGVRRRQETIARREGLIVVEDFGHHPTALAETLRSLRSRYPGHHLTACFEPRCNTAVKNVLQSEFAAALALADSALIGPIHRPDKIPPAERLDLARLTREITQQGAQAEAYPTAAALCDALQKSTADALPRVVVFFSNGSFDGIIQRYAEWAKRPSDCK